MQAIGVGTTANGASVVAVVDAISLRMRDIDPASAVTIGTIRVTQPVWLGVWWDLGFILLRQFQVGQWYDFPVIRIAIRHTELSHNVTKLG